MGFKDATPLLAAATYSDSPAVLQLLVEHGANVNSTSDWGDMGDRVGPLHLMAKMHANECSAWWLDQTFPGPAGDIDAECGNGSAPVGLSLVFGAGGGCRTAKLLIDRGASIEVDGFGQVLVTKAALVGDTEAIRMLFGLSQRARDQVHIPNLPTNAFFRRILWIFRLIYYSGDSRYWVYCFAATHGVAPLHGAAMNGNYASLKLLLEHRPNLSARLKIGLTARQQCEKWGLKSEIRCLIDAESSGLM
jgi:hypothetical protein